MGEMKLDAEVKGLIAEHAPEDLLAAIKAEQKRRTAGGDVALAPAENTMAITPKTFAQMGGTESVDFNKEITTQAVNSGWNGNASLPQQAERARAITDGLKAVAPSDAIEGMLAAQMMATHNATMECFRRAMINGQTHVGRETNLMHANRLTRSFTTLVHALDKHRGKGQQTVRVEHVHVYDGGQAIVGSVAHGDRQREETNGEAATVASGVGRGGRA